MEPKLPAPNFNPEQSLTHANSGAEFAPLTNPEKHVDAVSERLEQKSESQSYAGEANNRAAAVSQPVLTIPQDQAVQPIQTDDSIPLVAGDEDLIEKEWVDKAKKILSSTKDDPYRREQEVNRLQVEYLRKRYGRELGAS